MRLMKDFFHDGCRVYVGLFWLMLEDRKVYGWLKRDRFSKQWFFVCACCNIKNFEKMQQEEELLTGVSEEYVENFRLESKEDFLEGEYQEAESQYFQLIGNPAKFPSDEVFRQFGINRILKPESESESAEI